MPSYRSYSKTAKDSADDLKSNYWTYLHNYPCHHKLTDTAETNAKEILQLMMVRKYNIKNHTHHAVWSLR